MLKRKRKAIVMFPQPIQKSNVFTKVSYRMILYATLLLWILPLLAMLMISIRPLSDINSGNFYGWPTEFSLYDNFKSLINTGKFRNIIAKRNEDVMRLLTRLAVLNLLHPFQPFILGQKIFPIKIALKYRIPLIFYGENEAEH